MAKISDDTRLKEVLAFRVDELEAVLVEIWLEAEGCDGSRAQQQAALDAIQSLIEVELPNIEQRVEDAAQDEAQGYEVEEESEAERRDNGIFTDALRYTAGRIDKRKARKKAERKAVRIARASARS